MVTTQEKVMKALAIAAMGLTVTIIMFGMLTLAKQQNNRDRAWLDAMSAWETEMRTFNGNTTPADVLEQVKDLDRDIENIRITLDKKTEDRFHGADFRAFLEANPDLRPPTDRTK